MNESIELYKIVKEEIIKNKKFREEGKDISIPFPFQRFSEEIPGIQQGRYFITTAASKTGKTQITDFLFMYWPYFFIKSSNTNISIKINYFSLEMSKEDKVLSAIAFFLYYYKNIRKSTDELRSIFKNKILDNSTLAAITEIEPYVQDFLSYVTYKDNIRNPYGIFKDIRKYAHLNGHYIDKDGNILDTKLIETSGNDEAKKIFRYIPDKPDEFVINIVDHISLLTPEKGESLRDAMGRFSATHSIDARDRWKHIMVNVQQQSADMESVDNVAANMIRPSKTGLSDNKSTGNDVDTMLGLFSPYRFKRAEWEGYNIKRLKDSYRELSVIFNRRGSSVMTDLYFDGACSYFKELPKVEGMNDAIYKQLENRDIKNK